ncbi:MAG TPA: enoyl-CoA hydratase/isomerase family protein [Acidimicrobiales bacterium]|jgi:enoyl-CoA hydratase/carnithine racemase|nr:enoyl-CoA hydratase/isomerase family protein [Acidimicrobiales bacterium]
MTERPHASIHEDGGIITVMIDRPEKLNAISAQVTAAFWEAANALADRDDLRCMVIAAKGKYFTAGLDLSAPGGNRPGDPATQHLHPGWNFRRNYRSHHLLYDEFEAIEKPIILAAQGICLGAGVEMAASCDFRFCTPNAEFRLPEVQLGAIAGSGGTSRLTRIVGPAWGKWMAMAAMPVGAEQAKTIGLVHDIYPEKTFLDDVYAFCRHLISLPAEPLGLAKIAVDIYADVHDRTVQRHIDRLAVFTTIADFEKSMKRFSKDPK